MNTLIITTLAGKSIELTPIPMKVMPSADPTAWNAFQGTHLRDTAMSEPEQDKVQKFMRLKKTEALLYGEKPVTFAGGMLAHCYPDAVK